MDFGNINYGMPVPDSGFGAVEKGLKQGAAAVEGAEQAALTYAHGVLRNQSLQAGILLNKALANTHDFINQTPYMDRVSVQKMFKGKAWDALPEDLKKDVLGPVDNPDDPGVPMWKLVPHIVNQVGEEATDAAAKMITAPGWQNEFRTAAIADVQRLRSQANNAQFDSFRADSKLAEIAYYKQAMQGQNFDGAAAHINTMRWHSPAEKDILRREVLVGREISPLRNASLSQDPVKVQEAIDSISSNPEKFANVPADQLDFMQNKLENHQVQLQRRAEHVQAQFEKAGREAAGKQVFAAFRDSLATGNPISVSVVPDPDRSKGITVETSENLLNLVEKMNKRDQKSNLAVRQDLITLRARDNVKFQNMNLLQNAKYLSPEDYYALEKMQMEDRMKSQDAGHSKELARMHSDKFDAIHEFTGNKLKPQTIPADKAKFDSLEYALDQGIEAWQKNNGGKYPDRETIIGISNLTLGGKTGGWFEGTRSGSENLSKENLYVQSAIIKDVKQSGRLGTPEIYAAKLKDWKAERKRLVEAWDVHAPGDAPTDQAMYDVYRALKDPATVDRLNLDLAIKYRVKPTESARLQLLIGPYASEAARLKASDRHAAEATEAAALEEARREAAARPPPPPPPVSRVPAPLPAGD